MSTVLSWPQQFRRGLTALAERLEQSSSIAKVELLVVAIMAPTLVVLAVWLGSALGVPPQWNRVAATILGLVLVSPFMMREMLSSTQIETAGTPSTVPTPRATVVSSYYEAPAFEGWSGPMANFNSDELEFLSDLVGTYLEDEDDLSQREWGFAKGVLDKIEEAMDV